MTTRLPAPFTSLFGCPELHAVFFQPYGDTGGEWPSVMVMLPEHETVFASALHETRRLNARLAVLCDTAAQAERAAEEARQALPKHRRVSVERTSFGAWPSVH